MLLPFAILAWIGAGLVLMLFFWHGKLRTHPTDLILFQSVCLFCYTCKDVSYIFLFWIDVPTSICWVQALDAQFFGFAAISWNFIISANLFASLFDPFTDTRKYAKFYHLYVWTASLIVTIVEVCTGDLPHTRTNEPCGIGSSPVTFSLNVIPMSVYIVVSLVCVAYAYYALWVGLGEAHKERVASVHRFAVFLLLFVLCYTPVVIFVVTFQISDIVGSSGENIATNVMYWIADLTTSLFGCLSAIVWLTAPGLKLRPLLPRIPLRCDGLYNTLQSIFCCCCGCCWCCCLFKPDMPIEESSPAFFEYAVQMRRETSCALFQGIYDTLGTVLHDPEAQRDRDKYRVRKTETSSFRSMNLLEEECPLVEEKNMYDSVETIVMVEGGSSYFVTSACFKAFRRLRTICGVTEESFYSKMNPAGFPLKVESEDTDGRSEGRSGSFFFRSPCGTILIKSISYSESETLKMHLPAYLQHITKHRNSFVQRIYGLYAVRSVGGRSVYFIVMKNLFEPDYPISERYDIKGSRVGRSRKTRELDENLGLDLDFNRRLTIGGSRVKAIVRQLDLDASFLASCNIMDYSLLIGICPVDEEMGDSGMRDDSAESIKPVETLQHKPHHNGIISHDGREIFFFGIIDVLVRYDLNKRLERFIKTKILCQERYGISSVAPKLYADRFNDKMNTIFK